MIDVTKHDSQSREVCVVNCTFEGNRGLKWISRAVMCSKKEREISRFRITGGLVFAFGGSCY